MAASPTIGETGNNYNDSTWNSIQETLGRCVPKAHDELAEKSGESTIWDVGEDAVEEESISVRVCESLPKLVPFEVLVADTLLIRPHSLDSKESVALV